MAEKQTQLTAVLINVDGFHYAGVPVKKGATLNVTNATAEHLRANGITVKPVAVKPASPAKGEDKQ